MQAGVGAVIASVTVDMGMPIIKEKDSLSLVIMVGAFIAACVFMHKCSVHCGNVRNNWCNTHTSIKKEKWKMIYLQLFWSFIQIGMFSFGGGYAAMPLIQGQVVTDHGWADYVRVYGSYYDITDDTGTDCG